MPIPTIVQVLIVAGALVATLGNSIALLRSKDTNDQLGLDKRLARLGAIAGVPAVLLSAMPIANPKSFGFQGTLVFILTASFAAIVTGLCSLLYAQANRQYLFMSHTAATFLLLSISATLCSNVAANEQYQRTAVAAGLLVVITSAAAAGTAMALAALYVTLRKHPSA